MFSIKLFVDIKPTLIKLMLYISMMVPTIKNPLIMGVLLLMQTTITTIFMSKIMKSSWMGMITFLMLVGGLIILFMYMSSIASNEKFNQNLPLITLMMIVFIIPIEDLMIESTTNEKQESNILMESMSMSKMYNKKTMMITCMMFVYLFICMIAVTAIIKIDKGPLRAKYE